MSTNCRQVVESAHSPSLIMKASNWRPRLRRAGVDPALADWLQEPRSLTARLQRRGQFRVELLQQKKLEAKPDEFLPLGLPGRCRCWVREVALHCDGQVLVFAHTVLPVQPRGVLNRWFARLGSRSLGSLLFLHPGFIRGDLSFLRIDARHPLYRPAVAATGMAPKYFHARRCLHRYRQQAVLVTEIFSPALIGPAE